MLEVAHDEWNEAIPLASQIMSTIAPDDLVQRTTPPIRWRAAPNLIENRQKWGAQQWHPEANNMIGTLGEKSLHAAIKAWYAQPGDRPEWDVEGKYVVDIFRPATDTTSEQCIEIQTRSLGKLKTKLVFLLEHWPVRLVYPVAQERHYRALDADGEIVSRRKSPKRGTVFHLFPELVGLPKLVTHPHLCWMWC